MLARVKLALRISCDDFDTELADLIQAALADLGIVGVIADSDDPLIIDAVICYCKLNFGVLADNNTGYRLKKVYDEKKAQLSTATGYTNWGE